MFGYLFNKKYNQLVDLHLKRQRKFSLIKFIINFLFTIFHLFLAVQILGVFDSDLGTPINESGFFEAIFVFLLLFGSLFPIVFNDFYFLKIIRKKSSIHKYKKSLNYGEHDSLYRIHNIYKIINNTNYDSLYENKNLIIEKSKIFNKNDRKDILEILEKELDYHEKQEQRLINRKKVTVLKNQALKEI